MLKFAHTTDDREALQDGVVSRGLTFHLKIMRITDHDQLLKTMQGAMERGHNSISDALSFTTQEKRRLMYPSERDEAHRRGDRMAFEGDREDKPSLGWVVFCKGKYANYFGYPFPFALKRWGYVFWSPTRLASSRGREVIRRARLRW